MLDGETNRYLARTGPGSAAGGFFRRFWLPCLLASEVPEADGTPVRVRVLGEDLIAFRDSNGTVGLVDAYCAHRGAPLFFGRNEECGLRCVYHGWKYDVSGQCVDTPNEPPTSRMKDRIKITAYPTREAGGMIWAYLGPPGEEPPVPRFEWLGLPDSHCYIEKFYTESNWLQAVEGDFDSSHATVLHSSLLVDALADPWQMAQQQFADYQAKDLAPVLEVAETDYGLLVGSRRNAPGDTYWWRITPFLMPSFAIIPHEPGTALLVNIRIPIDDVSCWSFRVTYHPTEPISKRDRDIYDNLSGRYPRKLPGSFVTTENKGNDYLIDRARQRHETFSGIFSIPAQDRAVQEGMLPDPVVGMGLVDRSREHLGAADAAIVAVRARLLAGIRDLEAGTSPAAPKNPDSYFVRAPAVQLPRDVAFDAGAAEYIEGKNWDRQRRE
jgi:phthalate 4,5-dioxygenase